MHLGHGPQGGRRTIERAEIREIDAPDLVVLDDRIDDRVQVVQVPKVGAVHQLFRLFLVQTGLAHQAPHHFHLRRTQGNPLPFTLVPPRLQLVVTRKISLTTTRLPAAVFLPAVRGARRSGGASGLRVDAVTRDKRARILKPGPADDAALGPGQHKTGVDGDGQFRAGQANAQADRARLIQSHHRLDQVPFHVRPQHARKKELVFGLKAAQVDLALEGELLEKHAEIDPYPNAVDAESRLVVNEADDHIVHLTVKDRIHRAVAEIHSGADGELQVIG